MGKIEDLLREKINKDGQVIKKLSKGRSNDTYLVEIDEVFYTFRVPIEKWDLLVNREDEEENLKSIKQLNLTGDILYIDTLGYKIQKYIFGEDLLKSIEIPYQNIVLALRKLHSSELFNKDYDYLKTLNILENVNDNIDKTYFMLKKEFFEKYSKISEIIKVPSHNDLQKANIINSDSLIYFVDFEYSNNNDMFYDIACFSSNFFESIELLKHYKLDCSNSDIYHLAILRMYQTLKWYLLAKYKNETKYLKDEVIEFDKISKDFLEQAKDLYNTFIINNKSF